MIKLVAFDLDGTIANTLPMCVVAFKQAVTPYAPHKLTEEDVVKTFGLNEEGMIKQIVGGNNWQQALTDFYAAYKALHVMCPRPFEGIAEIIGELREQAIPLALITGKGVESCAITLQQFGLSTSFDNIETGSPERNRKAEAIEKLLSLYNLQPEELIYIGDAVSDVTECRKAGVRCLSAAWATTYENHGLLEQHNPNNVLYSVGELRDFLEKESLLKK